MATLQATYPTGISSNISNVSLIVNLRNAGDPLNVGDLLFISVGVIAGAGAMTSLSADGWTLVGGIVNSSTGSYGLLAKLADGTEGTTVNVILTYNLASTKHINCIGGRITGNKTSSLANALPAATFYCIIPSSANATFNAGPINPTTSSDLLLGHWIVSSGSNTISVAPVAMTQSNFAVSGVGTEVFYNQLLNSNSAVSKSLTWSASDLGMAIIFAVPPNVTNVLISRIFKWNTKQAISSLRTLKWNTKQQIFKLSTLLWNIRQPILKSNILKWSIKQQVSKLNILLWNTGARVTLNKIIIWNTKQAILSLKTFKWNTSISVPAISRIFKWNIKQQISVSKILPWNTKQKILVSRIIVWNVTGKFTTKISFLWDVLKAWIHIGKPVNIWTEVDSNPQVWNELESVNTEWH